MKKILLVLIVLLMPAICSADKFWIIIENKTTKIDAGEEAGQNEKGDVIAVMPYVAGEKPVEATYDRFLVKLVDMTSTEANALLEEERELTVHEDGVTTAKTLRARKNKMDTKTLPTKEELTKTELDEKVSTKPALAVVVEP